ncbi:MAG: tRNA dimethylallyltransferase [Clostridiales bacterium]|jgi:tRNA dimethylallyltransferase|nr:tRNA dimethylallyltransferase [Clostridiales bacterium]
MQNNPKIVILAGPTAVGKTDLSIALAKAMGTEIISADSVQIYKKLNIGSAKPTTAEMDGVVHHLIDFVPPTEKYSVSDYARDAKREIRRLHEQGKTPLIVGGTGLYINALLYEMNFGESMGDDDYRKRMEAYAETQGAAALHAKLRQIDPEAAERIHQNNIRRVVRALEINHISGHKAGDFATVPTLTKDYKIYLFGLTRDREKLYARINKRVDLMLMQGLIEEVADLKNMGLDDSFQSMQGIGYKEVLGYLNHLYDYDTMVSLLKQSSRRYAKRQMTWFRRYDILQSIDLEAYQRHDDIVRIILPKINIENEEEVQ